MRIFVLVSLFIAVNASVFAQQFRHIAVKDTISDKAIVLPESLESDVDSLFSGWYLKKYAIIDANCISGSVNIDYPDSVYIQRLSCMPTVIEMPFNQIVKSYITFYTERRRKLVENMMGLGTYYFPIFEQELEKAGLPLELKYLPIIESALRPEATSRAGAAGLWQFMIGTAKILGMEVNSLVDERRDPVKSSEMAAHYLKELYNIYNDWGLAIAAYNCGPGNVNKAIRRSGGKDYWEIYNFLPRETRGYLPAFIAANYVMHYYNEHNICPVRTDMPLTTDTVHINEQIHFQQIADVLDIPIDQLRSLNPQYRRDIIPGDSKTRALLLPTQQVYAFIEARDSIVRHQNGLYAKRTTVEPAGYSASNSKVIYHKIRRGDTLSKIAYRYGVTTQEIKRWNHLRGNTLIAGRSLKIYRNKVVSTPQKEEAVKKKFVVASSDSIKNNNNTEVLKSSVETVTQQKKIETLYHKIRSGETLSVIANRYGVSTSNLKKWNGLNSSRIRAGQKLKIQKTVYVKIPVNELSKSSEDGEIITNVTEHKVKSGETLAVIASKYGVTVNQLKEWNNLSSSRIQVGQRLKVSGEDVAITQNDYKVEENVNGQAKVKFKYHTVTKGESLWTISKLFPGVTSELIIKANNLGSSSLKVGQVLKIPVG